MIEKSEQDKLTTAQKNSKRSKQQVAADKEAEETFVKDYMRMGGIQHIVCSATMTIDNKGRITPRQAKIMKKRKTEEKD
jgi:hypothetical protein